MKYQSVTASGSRDIGINKIGICDKGSIPWPVFFQKPQNSSNNVVQFFCGNSSDPGEAYGIQGSRDALKAYSIV